MAEKKVQEDFQTTRTTVRSYASRVFKESSVGMVSSLAHTASARRRIFKVLALIFCLTGFLYQSGQFLAVVFQYPTSVDIDIIRPTELTVPAYTFCDNNGISRRMFCDKFPERCEKPDEAFCAKYENYCDGNRSLVPKKDYYSLHMDMNLEDMADFNGNVTDFLDIVGLDVEDEVSGPYLRLREFFEPGFLCYSVNDRVNSSLQPRRIKKNDLLRRPVNTLEFTIQQEDVFIPGTRAGILFAVHSPFQGVNPFETGIFMKAGRTYMIFVSMEEEVMLQEPYDTQCMNYTEIWEKNGFTGPRQQDMCKHDCFADISLMCFNCVFPMFMYPRHERICTADDLNVDDCTEEDTQEPIDKCMLKCRDDCKRTKYSYTIQERYLPSFDKNGREQDHLDSTIKVQVYLEGDEIIVLKHSPKYMIVEVFSNIGGFIGCWLGINLLDITDIFEGLFRILRYSSKRR